MEALIVVGLALVSQFVKGFLYPKFGANGVHAFAFALAFVVAGVAQAASQNPSILAMLQQAGILLVATVGIYEVVLKRIGFVSGREM